MSKVLFVNGNIHGHINPTIPLVKELVSRGEEVCYFSTAEFKEKIEKTGAKFIDYGSTLYQFLFGNKDAANFYPRFNFMPVKETRFCANVSVEGNTSSKARKLDMSNVKDIDILRRLALERIPLSSDFRVDHGDGILAWHCLNVFPEDIYYIEELDTIVINKVQGCKL